MYYWSVWVTCLKENRNSGWCDAERCWERFRLCFPVSTGWGRAGGWTKAGGTSAHPGGTRIWALNCCSWASRAHPALEWEVVGWEPSAASHPGCVNSEWWCWDGQDTGRNRTPGQTHPKCGGGFWSWFVPDSQFSSLNVSHSPLCVCAFWTPEPRGGSQPRIMHRIHSKVFQREFHDCEKVAEQFCHPFFLVFARNSERWLRMGAAQPGIAASSQTWSASLGNCFGISVARWCDSHLSTEMLFILKEAGGKRLCVPSRANFSPSLL